MGEAAGMTDISREHTLSAAFVKLADTLIADYDIVDLLHTLLEECLRLLDTQAGGLMLADASGTLQLIASTSEQADFVEIMQLNAGSGPCVESFTTGASVTVSDIDKHGEKWPEFRAAALHMGYLSIHAVPMRLRGDILGTMNLFRTSVGELTAGDAAAAQALADVATIGILQERSIRETSLVNEQLQRALDSRILIEQAKGVISELRSLDMNEAFSVLRSYSRSHNLSLRAVASDVVDRTLDIFSRDTEKSL
jgi:GAF domain-containing protein